MLRTGAALLLAACLAAGLGACSITADVYGIVGDENDIFVGKATGGMDGRGSMNLVNGRGTSCVGTFRYVSSDSGVGLISCSDGDQAQIQFNALSMSSGYGFGVSNTGRRVRFTFGLSRQEAAVYIGGGGQATPPTAPGTPPASPPAGGAAPPAERRLGSGTGFYISRQGHVLTNQHVIAKCKTILVSQPGRPPVDATLISADEQNDLAILSVGSPPPATATFRAGRPVRQGETVAAYGFPLSTHLSTGGIMTTGSVSALAGMRDDSRYIQMSAPVQPGNSGGPLLDSGGLIVGVVTAVYTGGRGARVVPQNVNFALKVDVVRTFVSVANVPLETSAGGRELSLPDVGERARAFTVFVQCRG